MLEAPINKMQQIDKTKDVENIDKNKPILQDFFFPQYNITIQAYSLLEAQQKLEQQLIKLNKNNNN